MDIGLHTTYDDTVSQADPEIISISDRITPEKSKEFGVIWDLFKQKEKPFEVDKYDVYRRNYTAPEVVVTATGVSADWDTNSDITALPVSSATIDRLTVGDVILVEAELVIVKSVDRSGFTIDVYERGSGDSVAVAHGTSAITAKVVGNAHVEGTVDAEAMAEETNKVSNYLQLIEEVIDLSKADSDHARKTGRTEGTLKKEALERVMHDMARSAVYGHAVLGTASTPSTTRGLLSYLNDVSGGLKTAVGGAFTETALKNILDDVRQAGGSINAIVMSVANKRIANGFTGADAIQVDRGEKQGGHILDSYIADGLGVIPFIVDIDMPDDKVAVVNTNFMEKGWRADDQLRFVKETNVNSRQRKETLQGKYGLSVENVGQTHGLLTGIS